MSSFSFFRYCKRTVLLCLLLTLTFGCQPRAPGLFGKIGQRYRDHDGDGWFTKAANQRVVLTLASVTWPQTRRGYRIHVDGIRFPLDEELKSIVTAEEISSELNIPVATRTVGTWLLKAPEQRITWRSHLRVSAWGPEGVTADAWVFWSNREEEITVYIPSPIGTFSLSFTTAVSTFADPDPENRDGDRDGDGILDWEEGELAEEGVGIGDPTARDILLVVGYTHSDWAMTPLTRDLLLSRFRQRGFNLSIAYEESEKLPMVAPGLMTHTGEPLPRGHALTLDHVRAMRREYIHGSAANYAHLLVLAEKLSQEAWGWAERPGRNLAVRSRPLILDPDTSLYQAKNIMHELGHNFGLCHPAESDESCASGPIPVAERNSAMSVMGIEMENGTDSIDRLLKELTRPLDYSRAQWERVRLDRVRPPQPH
ncbi:MAG: hypothetical protein ACE5GF_04590 [Thermodesulfobacteriota bacterium]